MILSIDAYKDKKINLGQMRIRDRGGVLVFGWIYKDMSSTLKKEKIKKWMEVAVQFLEEEEKLT